MKWLNKKIKDFKQSAKYNFILSFLKSASFILFLIAGVYILTAIVLSKFYYNGNICDILTNKYPLYSVKNFIDMLVAAGTLSLALVAYLQIKQNDKFRREDKEDKKLDFNKKRDSIYEVLISKINININFLISMQDIFDDTNKFGIRYNSYGQATLNMLKKNDEYSLLVKESIYFTTNAIDAIHASSTLMDMLIDNIDDINKKWLTPPFSGKTDYDFVLLNFRYYSAINSNMRCIIILINEGNLGSQISKDFIKGLITSLDTLESKIKSDKESFDENPVQIPKDYNYDTILTEIETYKFDIQKILEQNIGNNSKFEIN